MDSYRKTPEHKKWNGDMSKGAMNARPVEGVANRSTD
jgi:hypothetical protein